MQRSSPCLSPLLQCTWCTLPPLLCVPFQFLVYHSGFLCVCGRGSVCPGGYADLSQVLLWVYHLPLICSTIGLLDVSQVGLEPASGSWGALLFSQCNIVWRSFVRAGGSEFGRPDSSWCLFSAKCGPFISAKLLIHVAHTVCFCILVAILDTG
jgi:hypothetical protein